MASYSNNNNSDEKNKMSESGHEGCVPQPNLDDEVLDYNTCSERRTLFVGGIHPKTTEIDLRLHYCQFGSIEFVNLKMDPVTGRTRGYGFVRYRTVEDADNALSYTDHIINNIKVVTMRARQRHAKLFFNGLTSDLTDTDIRNYFHRFGSIVEVHLAYDKVTNERKRFGFVVLDSTDTATEILKNPKHTINGTEISVKRAKNTFRGMRPRDLRRQVNLGGFIPSVHAYGYGPSPGYTFVPYHGVHVQPVVDNWFREYGLPASHSHVTGHGTPNSNEPYYHCVYNYADEPEPESSQ